MTFIRGESYTRDQIHSEVGGDTVSYLPWKGDAILCGCFDPKANPEAPREILVGEEATPGRKNTVEKARMLAAQDRPIPVFLKQAAQSWRFEGYFRATRLVEDRDYLDKKQSLASRTDVVLAIRMEPAEAAHRTYLLNWKEELDPWPELEDVVQQTAEGRVVTDDWSTVGTKCIVPGDRLFVLRLGAKPWGIFAAGWATSKVKQRRHWDETEAEKGRTSNMVDLKFDRVLNPDVDKLLTWDELRAGPLAHFGPKPIQACREIQQGIDELERLWADLVGLYDAAGSMPEDAGAIEGAERQAWTRHRVRERWLRDAKIAQFRSINGGRLPCEACGFDFLDRYGEIGRDYAQVHHKEPLASRARPTETTLGDLAVVCANCHAMIHRGGGSRPVEGLLGGGGAGGGAG